MRRFSRFLIAFLFCFFVMEAVGSTRATPNLYEGSPSSGLPQFGQALQNASGIFHKFVTKISSILPPNPNANFTPQTFNITGTAGFETGLQKLAYLKLYHFAIPGIKSPPAAIVDWGDGTSDPALIKCSNFLPISPCYVYGTHVYQFEGAGTRVYTISIIYKNGPPLHLQTVTAYTTATISSVPSSNFVILTIGDSVASGEGNPVVPYEFKSGMNGAYWDDPGSDYPAPSGGGCHRSSKAGFAMAANAVAADNPGITTISVACSGDSVDQTVEALRYARQYLPRIDVLLISVGADDYPGGFGNLMKTCVPVVGDLSNLVLNSTPCSTDPTKQDDVFDFTQQLPQDYSDLFQHFNCLDPADSNDNYNSNPNGDTDQDSVDYAACTQQDVPKLVLITQYFDPTHDENGSFPSLEADPGCLGLEGSAGPFMWLYHNVVIPMNNQVDLFPTRTHQAGVTVPTYAVTGLEQAFLDHGYCAGGERWVNTLPDSLRLQISPSGTSHPNTRGQDVYARFIYDAIVKYNPPVTGASAIQGQGETGGPYQFNTWTSKNVTVSIFPPNQAIKGSGVGPTYYAVDDPSCTSIPLAARNNCTKYSGAFTIDTSGQHTVTFFGTNKNGYPEQVHNVEVLIDKSGEKDIAISPTTQTITAGQDVEYSVSLGHTGWPASTVNLSCKTSDKSASCSMQPSEVTVNGSNPPMSTVVISTAGCAPLPPDGTSTCTAWTGTATVTVMGAGAKGSATLVVKPEPSAADTEPQNCPGCNL